MIETVRLIRQGEETAIAVDELPLNVGAGSQAAVQLSEGESEGVHARIGLSDGMPFVQAAGQHTVFYNNERITTSRWLYDGDIIYFGSSRIRCEVAGSELLLKVQPLRAEAPPELPVEEPLASGESPIDIPAVTAVAVDAEVLRGIARARRRKLVLAGTLSLFVLLLLLGGFVFTAKSVAIRVKPQPDNVDISGGWLQLKLATRYLLRPGEYEFTAEKAGYQPLQKSFRVSDEQNQMVVFVMQPLPGKLALEIRPQVPVEIIVDGKSLGEYGQEPLAIPGGAHELEIRAEGYLTVSRSIDIQGAGHTQSLMIQLEPAWAEFSIDSEPGGARLMVDGKVHGQTPADPGVPLKLKLAEGTHQLSLELDEHATWQQTVEIVAGQHQRLPTVHLGKADGVLQLNSTPQGASVSVDGDYVGQTPLEIAVSAGENHQLSLTMAGYDPLRQSVAVDAGKSREMTLAMTARLGVVVLRVSPPDALLFVDGRQVPTPVEDGRLTLSAVPHRLEFRREGYHPYSTEVTPRSGLAKEVNIQLRSLQDEAAEKTAATPAGQITTAAGQVMRLVAPGLLVLGTSRGEAGRRSNETLQEVQLTRAFYLAEKEVTNAEFRAFSPKHDSGTAGSYSLQGGQQPVANVSWQQAAAYANWLSEQDGLSPAYLRQGDKLVAVHPMTEGYRLPTEAEWAWVARYRGRPAAPRYVWGEGFPPNSVTGNYADRQAAAVVPGALPDYDDGFVVSAPVGKFRPNLLGFYDLDGNVAEWTHDVYVIRTRSTDPVRDPMSGGDGEMHTVRGGSWYQGSRTKLRLAYRDYSDKPRIDLGFRLARYAEP